MWSEGTAENVFFVRDGVLHAVDHGVALAGITRDTVLTLARDDGIDVVLGGMAALVRAPVEQVHADRTAGWRTAAFVSGYPGSPLGGYDGVIGYWYGKAPGLERAADAIRHAQYAGTSPRGGVVAFVGDDPSCKFPGLPPGDGPCRARVRGMLWLPTWGSQRPRVNAA